MNTRNAYALRKPSASAKERRPPAGGPYGLGTPTATLQSRANVKAAPSGSSVIPVQQSSSKIPEKSRRHPLANEFENARLARCEKLLKGRFNVIVPTLKAISALQHEEDFPERAQTLIQERLGHPVPPELLDDAWVTGLNLKALYAYYAFAALKASAAYFSDDLKNQAESARNTSNFFLDCGFHAVNISPCADGRLKGLMPYILRLPQSCFTRRMAYAGALFDVETDVRHWMATELSRFREGVPTTSDAGTRYLKMAVYHFSSSDPSHAGCSAHSSNEQIAIEAALERLNQFRQAIENAFCCGASTDILLIGVDTDTDAIKVHVPDSNGDLSAERFVDSAGLYADTLHLSADEARLAVYGASSHVNNIDGSNVGHRQPHDGMRRLIANLLINNLSQIQYVVEYYGGRYADIGHAERYLSVGDGFEEVQMRNVAYYAHLHTVEEGAADLDVGIKIFNRLNVDHGLPTPVAIHYRYDARVPDSRKRTVDKARRVRAAILARYPELVSKEMLVCHLSIQDLPTGSPIEEVTAQ